MADGKPFNLTPARRALLRAVAEGRVRVDAFSYRYAWDSGTRRAVTAALYQLVGAGLVRIPAREPGSDRTVIAELTDAGWTGGRPWLTS